jgi:hypothetical protein
MKTDEHFAHDIQDAEFKEVLGVQQPLEIDQYQTGPPGYSPQHLPQADVHKTLHLRLLRLQRLVKWLSVVDILSILLFMVGLYFPLLILLPFPLLGFFASRCLSRALSLCYVTWLCVVMVIRLALLFLTRSVAFGVIDFFLIVLNICTLVVVVKFFQLIGTFTHDDIQDIKQGFYGLPPPQTLFQPQFQPPPELQSKSPSEI